VNGNETAAFAKNHQILSRIKCPMGNFDGFSTNVSLCAPRFRRTVLKTTGLWAIGDGLVKTIYHIHWGWKWSNYYTNQKTIGGELS
jgi:hypothetical protein